METIRLFLQKYIFNTQPTEIKIPKKGLIPFLPKTNVWCCFCVPYRIGIYAILFVSFVQGMAIITNSLMPAGCMGILSDPGGLQLAIFIMALLMSLVGAAMCISSVMYFIGIIMGLEGLFYPLICVLLFSCIPELCYYLLIFARITMDPVHCSNKTSMMKLPAAVTDTVSDHKASYAYRFYTYELILCVCMSLLNIYFSFVCNSILVVAHLLDGKRGNGGIFINEPAN